MTSSKELPTGGAFIKCKCGKWFQPIFENQDTCWECRKKKRYEECHRHAPKVLVVI